MSCLAVKASGNMSASVRVNQKMSELTEVAHGGISIEPGDCVAESGPQRGIKRASL